MTSITELKSDLPIRRAVEQELAAEPSVDASNIGVAAKDGVVTLSGHVGSHAEKVAAEQAAGRVYGVRAVVTELDVRLPGAAQVSDVDLARAAVEALSWNSVVPARRVKVRVEDSWLTLEGDVDWTYQKTAAYNTVAYLKGVRGVHDHIEIRPSSIANAVTSHIEAALERRFGAGNSHITVETIGGHVTLRGIVASLADRDAAEHAAWTTPGVCHVNNNLSVAAPRRRRPGARS